MALPTNIKTSTALKTAAAASVSTADAKSHLKVEHSNDDTLIDNLVSASEAVIEAFTGRKLVSQTWYFYLTAFPVNGITLPFNPVSSITSVKYYDTSNVQQTWANTNYNYNIAEEPCIIRYNDSAPATYEKRSDAIVVEFICGYANAAAVPEGLISAVLLKTGDLYENRIDAPREMSRTAYVNCATPYCVFHNPEENL